MTTAARLSALTRLLPDSALVTDAGVLMILASAAVRIRQIGPDSS